MRNRRSPRRVPVAKLGPPVGPVLPLAPLAAWRADNVVAGATTTQWTDRIGSAHLSVSGTAQGAPVSLPELGGRVAVPFAGTGGYVGTIPAPGNSQTQLVVGRTTVNSSDFISLSNALTPNSGSQIAEYLSTFFARINVVEGGDASLPGFSAPLAYIAIATLTTTGKAIYVNAKTPGTNAGSTASFSRTTLSLGVDLGHGWANGHIAEGAVWNRVLSGAEISGLLDSLGAYYGIAIGA